jgi:protein TonB
VARFQIQETGKCSVKIVTSSGSQEIDEIARETLQRWRFKPATVDGKAVVSSRKIRVEFEYD